MDSKLNRRDALFGSSAALLSLTAVMACSSKPSIGPDTSGTPDGALPGDDHADHDHAHHGSAHPELAAAAFDCVGKGDACVQHCLAMLGSGDTSMADCSKASTDMTAVARAIGRLANSGSKHIKAAATLAVGIAEDCKNACEPHISKHAECKACFESCTKLLAEAKKLA